MTHKLSNRALSLPLSIRYKDWMLGDFSILVGKMPYELQGVSFDRTGIKKMLAATIHINCPPQSLTRAPAVKSGRPPNDNAILTKADEMKAGGLGGYEIAKKMRLQPDFENVSTTAVRGLIKVRYRNGPPKKPAR